MEGGGRVNGRGRACEWKRAAVVEVKKFQKNSFQNDKH